MSGFESIIDQKQPLRILSSLLGNRNIPHALLFTGIEGVGKATVARLFAMACNCSAPKPEAVPETSDSKAFRLSPVHEKSEIYGDPISPCSVCKSCRKIETGNHPDIIHVKPSGPFIRIDQIRTLCSTLALKPYEAKLRVVIISDAHTMNPPASNALLKVLEEPPEQTLLVLTALHPSDLLPTVASRCQHIRFNPISRKHLAEKLVETAGLDPDDAAVISTMANGSYSKAFSMTRPGQRDNWIERRRWLLGEVDALSSRPISLKLAFAARLAKDKEILPDSLEVIKTYLRDLVVAKYYPEKIINKDLTDKIQYASQKMSVASLLKKIKNIQTTQKDIQANANLRLALEVLMVRLAESNTGA